MSSKLGEIMDMLCVGRCQTLNDLRKETHLSERQIKATAAFLVNYGFAEMNKENEVRITRAAEKLFNKHSSL